MSKTIDYYNSNYESFINDTLSIDFSLIQDTFLSYLFPKAYILDFGCGSGRDTKYFLSKGYIVDAIDGSSSLCKVASLYTGIEVKEMLFENLEEREKYDGIWACSSILHLHKEKLVSVIKKMSQATKKNGIIYISFKYGDFEGERNGRYFTDMTENSIEELLVNFPELSILKEWITVDVRPNRGNERWLNIILRK